MRLPRSVEAGMTLARACRDVVKYKPDSVNKHLCDEILHLPKLQKSPLLFSSCKKADDVCRLGLRKLLSGKLPEVSIFY